MQNNCSYKTFILDGEKNKVILQFPEPDLLCKQKVEEEVQDFMISLFLNNVTADDNGERHGR